MKNIKFTNANTNSKNTKANTFPSTLSFSIDVNLRNSPKSPIATRNPIKQRTDCISNLSKLIFFFL